MLKVILIVSSLIHLFSIFLNVLGVYLLTAIKPLSIGKFLLTNLAVSEIILSGVQIAVNSIRAFVRIEENTDADKVRATIWLVYYSSVFFLTIDRLIAINFPLRYRVLITKKRLKLAILVVWTLATALGASFFIYGNLFISFWNMTWMVLDVAFIILAVTTYGFIFFKILRRRRFENNDQDGRRQHFIMSREKKFVKIAGLIIGTFLFLFLIPDTIKYGYPSLEALLLTYPIGILLDPVIYIFLQEDLRSLLKRSVFQTDNGANHAQQDTAL